MQAKASVKTLSFITFCVCFRWGFSGPPASSRCWTLGLGRFSLQIFPGSSFSVLAFCCVAAEEALFVGRGLWGRAAGSHFLSSHITFSCSRVKGASSNGNRWNFVWLHPYKYLQDLSFLKLSYVPVQVFDKTTWTVSFLWVGGTWVLHLLEHPRCQIG